MIHQVFLAAEVFCAGFFKVQSAVCRFVLFFQAEKIIGIAVFSVIFLNIVRSEEL